MRPSRNAVVAGFPKSWRHGAEHHDELIGAIEIVDALPRLIDHLQRVHPHVAFGMPFRLLLAADERLQLRKQLVDDAELQRERKSDRRALRRAAAASRSLPRCARAADRRGGSSGTASSCRSSSVISNRAANWTARSTRRLSSPNVPGSTALRILRVEIVRGR